MLNAYRKVLDALRVSLVTRMVAKGVMWTSNVQFWATVSIHIVTHRKIPVLDIFFQRQKWKGCSHMHVSYHHVHVAFFFSSIISWSIPMWHFGTLRCTVKCFNLHQFTQKMIILNVCWSIWTIYWHYWIVEINKMLTYFRMMITCGIILNIYSF